MIQTLDHKEHAKKKSLFASAVSLQYVVSPFKPG